MPRITLAPWQDFCFAVITGLIAGISAKLLSSTAVGLSIVGVGLFIRLIFVRIEF